MPNPRSIAYLPSKAMFLPNPFFHTVPCSKTGLRGLRKESYTDVEVLVGGLSEQMRGTAKGRDTLGTMESGWISLNLVI